MSSYLIPSLEVSCQLIKLVVQTPSGLTRDEIEKKLNIPRSTAYRILQTLLHEGFLERRQKRYFAGSILSQLGLQLSAMDRLRPLLRPVVHSLAQTTNFTAHLAVPSGYQAMLLEVCDSQNLIRVASRAGTLVPLHVSATGKIFLAHLFANDLDSIEEMMGFPCFTERSLKSVEAIRKSNQTILAKGYAIDERELNDSVRCLAAPVHDLSGTVIAAIGITAPISEFRKGDVNRIAEVVKQHARRCYQVIKGTPETE